MANDKKQLAIFPDMPRDTTIVDQNGDLTSHWRLFFEQTVQALQTNLKPEGTVIPQHTTANIALLTNINSKANIIYNSDTNSLMGNIEGPPGTYTWKTFLS